MLEGCGIGVRDGVQFLELIDDQEQSASVRLGSEGLRDDSARIGRVAAQGIG